MRLRWAQTTANRPLYLALAAGVAAAVVVVVALINAGVLWDYGDTKESGRIFTSLIGLGVIGLPVYLHIRNNQSRGT